MTTPGIVAAIGAIVLGVASFIGWGSTSTSRDATATSATSAALDGTGLGGTALFRAKGCSTCHDGPETDSLIDGFPSLADVASFAGSRRPGYTAAGVPRGVHQGARGVLLSRVPRRRGPDDADADARRVRCRGGRVGGVSPPFIKPARLGRPD